MLVCRQANFLQLNCIVAASKYVENSYEGSGQWDSLLQLRLRTSPHTPLFGPLPVFYHIYHRQLIVNGPTHNMEDLIIEGSTDNWIATTKSISPTFLQKKFGEFFFQKLALTILKLHLKLQLNNLSVQLQLHLKKFSHTIGHDLTRKKWLHKTTRDEHI